MSILWENKNIQISEFGTILVPFGCVYLESCKREGISQNTLAKSQHNQLKENIVLHQDWMHKKFFIPSKYMKLWTFFIS